MQRFVDRFCAHISHDPRCMTSLSPVDVVVRADDSKGVPYEPHRFRLQKAHPSLFDDPRILQTLKTNPRHPLHETTSKEPGCRVQGTITVKRVAGEVYVTNPRLSSHGFHAHYPNANFDELMNSFIGNHTINHISFGPPFPGQLSPLDNFVSPPQPTASRYLYHIKVCAPFMNILAAFAQCLPSSHSFSLFSPTITPYSDCPYFV